MSTVEWSTAVDEFKLWLEADERHYVKSKPAAARAESTREGYVRHIRWLADAVSCGPWKLTSSELALVLSSQNWSAATRQRVLVSLRTFYSWAVGHGKLEWAPTAGLAAAPRRSGPVERPWQPAWGGPVEEFLKYLRGAGRSENTIRDYAHRLRLLSDLAADPWSITTEQLAEWLSNPEWTPYTRRNRRVTASSFYRWAERTGRVSVSPVTALPPVRVPRALPRPAPHDVVREALAAADDRCRLAMLLAVDAGLRRAEIANLHTSQVSETHLLIVGKGGHHRQVPLDPDGDLASALRVELERRRRGEHGTGWRGPFVQLPGYLFPSDRHPGPITARYLGKLITRAMGGEWTAHPLRHRFATDAYAVERDLQAVQQLLGHSKPETTSVYAQVPDGAMLTAVRGVSARRRSIAP